MLQKSLTTTDGIGEATHQVIQGIFDSYRIEEQAYKSCLSLLKLADKYSTERLEHACRAALVRIPSPRYKNIRLILESGNDKAADPSNRSAVTSYDESYAWSGEHLTTEVAAMKNDTLKKLKAMRLPAFAEAYEKQIVRESDYEAISFHERLMLLVDAEYDSRHNNNIKRLIKNAKFSDASAFLGNIEYLPDRHLNRDLLESLADNDYIRQGLNVILIGATGSGKSFIANALGVNACQSGYKTRYLRLPELFSELEAARIQGKYHQVMKQLQKLPLVILDEFLLIPASDQEQRDLLELMEYRCVKRPLSSVHSLCLRDGTKGWAAVLSPIPSLTASSLLLTPCGLMEMFP